MLQTVFYVIIFLLILAISNVLSKLFPKLPLPLVQVVVGLVLGFFGAKQVINIPPDIFLAFIIVPLLYRESEEAEVRQIFKNTRVILVLIVPLVFLSALLLGYITHFAYLDIPLAAAIALGATLAPTDAVVVSSLSERNVFPRRIISILKGESLFNDASGLIAFEFALFALETSHFSVVNASTDLIIASLGGAAIGLFLVWINNLFLTILEDVAAQDTSGYLMLEFAVPLAAYLLAEALGVSGIIAVVVSGVMQANGIRKSTLFDAQVTQMKNTVWGLLTFVLNSIVFIFLGIELEELIIPVFNDSAYSNTKALVTVLVLTFALFAVRFVVIALHRLFIAFRKKQRIKLYFNDMMLLTFSGAKGTIGIAAILLLPVDVPEHALLVFFCAAVTGLSFLVSLFIVPLFTVRKVEKVDNVLKIAMLTEVVEELRKSREKSDDVAGYNAAIDAYMERIQQLIIEQESAMVSSDFNDLQVLIIRLETEGLEEALRNEEINMYTYRTYQRYLHSLEQSVMHEVVSSIQFAVTVILRMGHLIISRLLHIDFSPRVNRLNKKAQEQTNQEITDLYFKNTEMILETLEHLEEVYDSQLINFLQGERIRSAAGVAEGGYMSRLINRMQPANVAEMAHAYYLERTIIRRYEEEGQLKEKEAQEMKMAVNVMEDFTLIGERPSVLNDFLSKYRQK